MQGISYQKARDEMVEWQIRRRGIVDARVLEAIRTVPRHEFVDESYRDHAYGDYPLTIGHGQTISQPYMVALMVELAAPQLSDRALEIGAGSGYQTAILSLLVEHVYAVEYLPALAATGAATLQRLGYANVTVTAHDGSRGWPEHAPYDVIIVAAGAPDVPEPLKEQLADGGRLVIPVGNREHQVVVRIKRSGNSFEMFETTPCRFVDLKGTYGWS